MPARSRTLVTNCGSVDSFQVSTMCGLRPNARQIRETADCDMPSASAIERIDQCESPVGGAWPSILATRASTCSSVILRGGPERGRSARLSSRFAANRDRHLRTVSRETPRSSATRAFGRPYAHASTILDRNTNA
ncbi:hypothetical protein M271_17190 [Streptomyces rapamycinicus NRRL 5491]|uniref:Uncharacterized protein n=1 Tax=Streptomyces rapamycinicus (strain ATCC 29253 / DSM 41530 / NRRL 5491 / AYB-994) TaxID=1343740 RepID=A0A0A0NCN8_STRRN|nr:hypothetical protein M271_17190 [Streptomyces rapamycinicus NRRL 5491]RLV81988.1 hypothetical protein D3C57_126425 [Streptomyces rapamycinicus NRRL 5491]